MHLKGALTVKSLGGSDICFILERFAFTTDGLWWISSSKEYGSVTVRLSCTVTGTSSPFRVLVCCSCASRCSWALVLETSLLVGALGVAEDCRVYRMLGLSICRFILLTVRIRKL